MHQPVNLTSITLAAFAIMRPYHSDPGGFRTHDLRIKRSYPANNLLAPTRSHIVADGKALVRTHPETSPLGMHVPVRTASL